MDLIKKLNFIIGDYDILQGLKHEKPLVPFCDESVSFLSDLSKELLREKDIDFSDIITFAFWCRKANLEKLKSEYMDNNRLGRGISLHFAASNMPLMFAYTFSVGILSGNCVILRLSEKKTESEKIVIDKIINLLNSKHKSFKNRIVFLRYEHDYEINDMLSKMCDVRVMWGSDNALEEIKKSKLTQKSIDIPFPSRSSLVILKSSEVLKEDDIDLLIKKFYNDTFLYDQNACSSPRIVYWYGNKKDTKKARELFWYKLNEMLDKNEYIVQPTISVGKLSAAFIMADKYDDVKIKHFDNKIVLVKVKKLKRDMWEDSMAGGFFIESEGESMEDILPICTKYAQTLSAFGFDNEKIVRFLIEKKVFGIDRVVDIGNALDFSILWDGFDLIDMMSRKIGML